MRKGKFFHFSYSQKVSVSIIFKVVFDKVSLCIPGIHDPPASSFQVVGSQACTTMLSAPHPRFLAFLSCTKHFAMHCVYYSKQWIVIVLKNCPLVESWLI
jgi:hypothetical protein